MCERDTEQQVRELVKQAGDSPFPQFEAAAAIFQKIVFYKDSFRFVLPLPAWVARHIPQLDEPKRLAAKMGVVGIVSEAIQLAELELITQGDTIAYLEDHALHHFERCLEHAVDCALLCGKDRVLTVTYYARHHNVLRFEITE